MGIDTGAVVEPLQGAEAVLAGVGMSKTDRNALVAAWRPLSGQGRGAQMKVLNAFAGGRDLEWPWFDDCLARFEKLGRYPDASGWDVFHEEDEDGQRAEGPDADDVQNAKLTLLAASMSAADYVAERVEQLRAMVRDGSMSGIRIEPSDAIAQAAMHDPSPYCPQPGLPPFFPGDSSGVSGIRAERFTAASPSPQVSAQQIAAGTARGIASEKTSESVAVFKVIGAVLLAWIVGAMADSVVAGVVLMLLLFIPIWKSYRN